MALNQKTKKVLLQLFYILLYFIPLYGFSQQTEVNVDSLPLSIKLADAILNKDTLTFDSLIVSGMDVNVSVFEGVTAIMYAAQEGNLYFIRKLLAAGANVNQVPDNKITALQSAVVSNNIESVRLLLGYGAEVNTKDQWGNSPVLSAAQNNNTDIVRLLTDSGAAVNDSDDYDNTPLHYAAAFGNDSMVSLLMNAGAEPNVKEKQGFTPLMVATSQNFNSTAELFVSYGADLNKINREGYSALSIAVLNDNAYLAELFLLNGAGGNHMFNKAKDLWYLSKGTGKEMRKVLRKSDVKRNLLPVFGDWAGGMNFSVADKHLTTFLLFGVRETKYNFWIQTAFGLTPFVYSSLTEMDHKKYQFWERNYRLNMEADKYFSLYNTYKKEWG